MIILHHVLQKGIYLPRLAFPKQAAAASSFTYISHFTSLKV
jgi:hypothetical protein